MSIMYRESTQPKTPLLLARYEAGKGASDTWFLIWAYIEALTRVIPRLKLDNRAMWCQIMPSIMCPITRRRKNRSMTIPYHPFLWVSVKMISQLQTLIITYMGLSSFCFFRDTGVRLHKLGQTIARKSDHA